jgi:signal transduction histidine kinase
MSQKISHQDETLERLRGNLLFADLTNDQLERLVQTNAAVSLDPGDVLLTEGEPSTCAYLILDGELEISRRSGETDVPIAIRTSGEVVGEMGLLTDTPRNATIRSHTSSTLLPIARETFHDILAIHPDATIALLRTVMHRLQSTEAQLVQQQKMAALGTLAAGLTHELNNPAAAITRSADQLRHAITEWEYWGFSPGIVELDGTERAELISLRQEMLSQTVNVSWLDPITRTDREGEITQWLTGRQIGESWVLAPRLVDAGWDLDALNQLDETVASSHLADVLWWLASGQTVFLLLHELTTSARATSDIVAGVKAYTRLDQAPIQDVDVHEGLEQTLAILRHALRGIRVRREYGTDLPHIPAYAGELNQVWTNLLDNAAAALGGQGEIVIRTARDGGRVVVEVCDTGPGIPQEVQQRLFEPFFTTKPPGAGTGLGLAITYNIVRKHQGDIQVASKPGQTCFAVRLPVGTAAPMSGGPIE